MRLRHLLTGLAVAALGFVICPRAAQAYHSENIIGAVHNAGVYYFAASGGLDYLDEGFDEITALGTHIAKLELDKYDLLNTWTDSNSAKYPWHSSWTAVNSSTTLTTLATSTYFKNVFSNPSITTYVLTTYCPNVPSSGGDGAQYWYNGNVYPMPSSWLTAETTQIQNVCANLLANYSGKTFVIENWEGDGALQNVSGGTDTSPVAVSANTIKNYTAWMNARALGVHNAMANKGSSTSNCYCAVEANLVKDGILEKNGGIVSGFESVVDDVLPNTSVDYASYSAYDSMYTTDGEYSFANCVNWIELHCPSTVKGYSGGKGTVASVGVGEFGVSIRFHSTSQTCASINNVLPVAFSGANMPYVCYWNIYDNDLSSGVTTAPQNGNDDGCTGFWMIKPDGTPDIPWHLWRWQCITTDSVRSNTTDIKAGLTNTYNSNFTTSGLGTGWTTETYSGDVSFTYASGSFTMKIVTGSANPYGLATLDVATVSSLGRGLEPGEYCEYPMNRNSNAGEIGSRLFGDSAGSDIGSGTLVTFDTYDLVTSAWQPISYYWDTPIAGNNPGYGNGYSTYNFNTSEKLGIRLDSADGIFATVSYYWNGAYLGSWLYPTTDTTLDSVPMFAQDTTTGDTFTFGNISVYQQ